MSILVRTTHRVPQQVGHGESLSKNEKDKMRRTAPNTKVCINSNIYVTRIKSISEHRIQAEEVDREFY